MTLYKEFGVAGVKFINNEAYFDVIEEVGKLEFCL